MTSAPPNSRRAFTLIELLAVVAIIGVMIAVLVPSFAGLLRGSKTTGAVAQLKTTMSLARQWAITQRENVFIVFPDESINYSPFAPHVDKACRAYGVYGERSGYLRDWTYLPEGVVFVGDENDFKSGSAYGPDNEDNPMYQGNAARRLQLPFPSNNSPRIYVPAFLFRPDGRSSATNVGTTVSEGEVYLAEGWVETVGAVASKPTYKGPEGDRPFWGCQIYYRTGKMRVRDYKDK